MYIEDFKERLEFCCDVETFVDTLDLTMEDLMDAFEERMIDNKDKFDDLFNITGEFGDE